MRCSLPVRLPTPLLCSWRSFCLAAAWAGVSFLPARRSSRSPPPPLHYVNSLHRVRRPSAFSNPCVAFVFSSVSLAIPREDRVRPDWAGRVRIRAAQGRQGRGIATKMPKDDFFSNIEAANGAPAARRYGRSSPPLGRLVLEIAHLNKHHARSACRGGGPLRWPASKSTLPTSSSETDW